MCNRTNMLVNTTWFCNTGYLCISPVKLIMSLFRVRQIVAVNMHTLSKRRFLQLHETFQRW